ncbi:ABC transporter substrate-binding protein [Bacillota bacterium LX-D]|nr:ABC transporter substrate-binding protein [Bacillota bacterium LX-D]
MTSLKTKTVKILVFAIVAAIAITLFTAGCAKQSSQKLTKVRLCEVVHSIFYAPQYVAINKGFFKDEGLEIELSTGQGADKVMTALLSNSADIGLAGPEATVYVYNQGQKDYVVNFAQLTKRDGSFLVGRKQEPNFKWENLKGKTVIGGRPGGVPEMVLEYILKEHGLTPGKDVNIITNLQFTATAGAFKGGTGDYVALFEPTASMLEKEKAGYVIASNGLAGGEVPFTAFMAKKSYIEKNSDVVQKFTNAIYKAQTWVDTHSAQEVATAIRSFFPETDLDILIKVVTRYKYQDTWDKNPILESSSLDHLQKIIKTAGELDKTIDSDTLITRTFAQSAMQNK